MAKVLSKICSGYQAVVEAAIQVGCRAYYASPSPFHALLMNEGAQRLPAVNGWFVQAESPASALAMAQGTAATGHPVLVSGNDQDFMAMQEVLGYCVAQRLPVVIAILNDGGAAMTLPRPAGHQLRYYLAPRMTGGFSLTCWMPTTSQHVYELTQAAFVASWEAQQPSLLLLESPVFHAAGPVQPNRRGGLPLERSGPLMGHCHRLESAAAIQQLAELMGHHHQTGGRAQIHGSVEDFTHLFLAVGSIGAWLQQQLPPSTCLVIPETLFPFPEQQIDDLRRRLPAHGHITWWEYDYPWLAQELHTRYPHWNLQSQVVAFESLMLPVKTA